MPREFATSLVSLLLMVPTNSLIAADDAPSTYVLATNAALAARVSIAPKAYMGKRRWMVVELENKSGEAIEVVNVQLRADLAVARKSDNTPLWSSNLIAGALPRPGDLFDDRDPKLAPGVAAISDLFSQHAGTSMGIVEEEVTATTRWFGMIDLRDGSTLSLPKQGVEIKFTWGPPPAEQIDALERRLRSLFGKNDLEYRFPTPATVEFYATRIGERDMNALGELAALDALDATAPDAWRDGIIARLIDWMTDDDFKWSEPQFDVGMMVLSRHRGLWIDDDRTPARLSQAILRSPLLAKAPGDLEEKELLPWIARARALGRTGDARCVAKLEPFLTVARKPTAYRVLHHPGGMLELSVDEGAALSILELLGASPVKARAGFGEALDIRGEKLVQAATAAIEKARTAGRIPPRE